MNPRAPRCVLITYDEDDQQIETCTVDRAAIAALREKALVVPWPLEERNFELGDEFARNDPARAAVEKVANQRRDTIDSRAPATSATVAPAIATGDKTRTGQGNYGPYRHRKENSRTMPPGSKRTKSSSEEVTA